MLNIRYLSYFMATAKHGSFTKAAVNVSISKSAIVRAVDLLEEDCGTRLFVRERAKGVRLTKDGEQLFQMCQSLFQDMRHLESKMSDLGTVSGKLVLACIESLAACIVPDLIMQTLKAYPNLEVTTLEAAPDKVMDLVREGEADVLINAQPIAVNATPPKWLEYKVLMKPLLCVTLSAQHPLAEKASVTLEDLLEYPMVLMSTPYIAKLSLLYFKRIHRQPEIAVRTNTIENLRALIGKGFGYGLTHFRPMVDTSFTGDKLVTRPVAGVEPGIEIIAGCTNRSEQWMPAKTRAFLTETRNYFSSSKCADYFLTPP